MYRTRSNGEKLALGLGWFSLALGAAEVFKTKALSGTLGLEKQSGLVRFYGLRELAAGTGILSQAKPLPWLWGRLGGDALDLLTLGLAYRSDNPQRKNAGIALGAVAAVTVLDAICARMLSREVAGAEGPDAARAVTIGKPAEELYERLRDPQTLPQIMGHFAAISSGDASSAHWQMAIPGGKSLEWDTQIVESRPPEVIRWQTVDGAALPHEGTVQLRPAPGNRGTEVLLQLDFNPPGGVTGQAAAKLLGFVPGLAAEKALRRFKSLVETGEIPTLEQNPSGRGSGDKF